MPEGRTPFELLRSLAVLAERPTEQHGGIASALDLSPAPSPEAYSDVFAFQLYPFASVYLGPEGMLGGEARGRISGLWQALGLESPSEPDHLAALLGLYAELGERAAGAEPAESLLFGQAQTTLLAEHLAPWIFAWLDRVHELGPPTYAGWAQLLGTLLEGEAVRLDLAEVPIAALTRSFSTLPDPRAEGSEPFLKGVLAYARSGMIVTRADLARIAVQLDLGLRAGERRYALEHLLAQDATGVLNGLADLARDHSARHEARAPWLGQIATHFEQKAGATEILMRALATEAASAGLPA